MFNYSVNVQHLFSNRVIIRFIPARKRSCSKVMLSQVFVCGLGILGPMSFCGKGRSLSYQVTSRGVGISRGYVHWGEYKSPRHDTSVGGVPTPPLNWETMRYGPLAGGIHPTGTRSCCKIFFCQLQTNFEAISIL